MNKRTYLKRMSALTKQLKHTQMAEPYDPDAYNNVIDEMNRLNALWHRHFTRKRRVVAVVWILLALLLLLLIFFGRYLHES